MKHPVPLSIVPKIFWIAVGAAVSMSIYTMIPVEGHKNLYREESGAIVNTDTNNIKVICKTIFERRQKTKN